MVPGVDAVAQVDLGQRGHRHQNLHDLGAMAFELLAVAERRNGRGTAAAGVMPAITRERTWQLRAVDLTERPPAVES